MSFLYKILFNKEFNLYELLKLKKTLEKLFLNSELKINNKKLKFKIRFFFITQNISTLFKSNVLDLIQVIEIILDKKYSNFKQEGENFIINDFSVIGFDKTSTFFERLIFYNSLLEKYNASLIIQGSYADGTYLSYSDIDLVIIGNLSINIIEIKNAIEKDILKLDPLQHHGVFFINKKSFSNYWQMDLPILTLKKSIVLSEVPLKINIPYYFSEKYSSFYWLSNFINCYPTLPIRLSSGVFFTKYFLSQLMLVPALLLALKGSYVYKQDSFSLAKKYYSLEAWKCIKIASFLREIWNQQNINLKYISNREDLEKKKVDEYNILSEVVDFDEQKLNEFSSSYSLIVIESNQLLTVIKNDI